MSGSFLNIIITFKQSESDDEDLGDLDTQTKPHKDPNSYAWLLIRFACVVQHIESLKRFLSVAGFEQSGLFLSFYRWANQIFQTHLKAKLCRIMLVENFKQNRRPSSKSEPSKFSQHFPQIKVMCFSQKGPFLQNFIFSCFQGKP